MNIALIANTYPPEGIGGIAEYTRLLAEGCVAAGHAVTVFATGYADRVERENGVTVRRYRQRQVPFVEARYPGWRWSQFIGKEILRWHRHQPFDVVEFPNWEGVGAWWGGDRAGIRTIVRVHTPYYESLALRGKTRTAADEFVCKLERKSVAAATVRVVSTREHRDEVAQAYGMKAENFVILPLGIDPGPEPGRYGREAASPEILYVSRLETRKGTETFLRALPAVFEQVPGVQVRMIGQDRPHAPGGIGFESWFSNEWPELAARVNFCGTVGETELRKAYDACDVFCVPSAYESFGLVFVEAMARGRPVVACAGGGVPEVVADGETGFLAPVGDHQAVADNLVRLCKDESLRDQLGRAARADVLNRFAVERMVKETLAVYGA